MEPARAVPGTVAFVAVLEAGTAEVVVAGTAEDTVAAVPGIAEAAASTAEPDTAEAVGIAVENTVAEVCIAGDIEAVERIVEAAGGIGTEVEERMGTAFEEDNYRMENMVEDNPSEDSQVAMKESFRGCLETFRTGCRRSGSRRY